MYSILLIEDEQSMRLGLMHALKMAGYKVRTAENGNEGIRLAEKDFFDIVVTDLRLPGADGLEILRRVRTFSPDTGFIVITAFAEVKTAVEAMKEGAYDYLSKPFDPEELQIVIDRFLKHKELESENIRLKEEIRRNRWFEEMIGTSPAMKVIFEKVSTVARTDSTVLIQGETGTGKELVANAIHNLSPRRDKPFIKVNCAAIPETLIESELFGHEKGAFTGALQRRKGKFETAHGGTILLDEIGDMPLPLQAKLLRVIENRSFERLGSNEPVQVDIRTICATAKDLKQEKGANRFRADLYYRLNVLPITLPPLRDRREDIPLLVRHFLEKTAKKIGKPDLTVSPAALSILMAHDYPGNVRELKHAVEMVATFCKDGIIEPDCLPEGMRRSRAASGHGQGGLPPADTNLPITTMVKNFEREIINQALKETGGRKTETATRLGVSRGTLWRKLKEHGFSCTDSDPEE